MSDKSDTPRTDERCAAIMAWQAKESDWPDFARQLERELAAERDAHNATANNLGKALTRAEKAEAECERLRSALRQLADNKLSDENCASVEVAGRRVANIARDALSAARKP